VKLQLTYLDVDRGEGGTGVSSKTETLIQKALSPVKDYQRGSAAAAA